MIFKVVDNVTGVDKQVSPPFSFILYFMTDTAQPQHATQDSHVDPLPVCVFY
jgi:hypothetical protein